MNTVKSIWTATEHHLAQAGEAIAAALKNWALGRGKVEPVENLRRLQRDLVAVREEFKKWESYQGRWHSPAMLQAGVEARLASLEQGLTDTVKAFRATNADIQRSLGRIEGRLGTQGTRKNEGQAS